MANGYFLFSRAFYVIVSRFFCSLLKKKECCNWCCYTLSLLVGIFHAMPAWCACVHHAKECAHSMVAFSANDILWKRPIRQQQTQNAIACTKCGHLQHYEFLHRHLFREYEWHPVGPRYLVMHLSIPADKLDVSRTAYFSMWKWFFLSLHLQLRVKFESVNWHMCRHFTQWQS